MLLPGCSWQGGLLIQTHWNKQLHSSGTKWNKQEVIKLCKLIFLWIPTLVINFVINVKANPQISLI